MNKCPCCNSKVIEDELAECNLCSKVICMNCDEGSVKDGWLCDDCKSNGAGYYAGEEEE